MIDIAPADPIEGILIAQLMAANEASLCMYRKGWDQPPEYFEARTKYVGSPIKDIERDQVLETLAKRDGNRTASARLLGFSIRTLRNKITEYSADGVDVPPPGGLT
jgi:DNA-binding NtrC family response regulator